jgi:hypothetical protein
VSDGGVAGETGCMLQMRNIAKCTWAAKRSATSARGETLSFAQAGHKGVNNSICSAIVAWEAGWIVG